MLSAGRPAAWLRGQRRALAALGRAAFSRLPSRGGPAAIEAPPL